MSSILSVLLLGFNSLAKDYWDRRCDKRSLWVLHSSSSSTRSDLEMPSARVLALGRNASFVSGVREDCRAGKDCERKKLKYRTASSLGHQRAGPSTKSTN